MNSPIDLVFKMMRHYVQDRSLVLGPQAVSQLQGWMRARDISRLAELSNRVGDSCVTTPTEAQTFLQISSFVKKNEDLTNPDCEDTAIRAFARSEVRCRITNRRLTHYYLHPGRLDPELAVLVSRMRRIIATVLGDERVFLREIPSRLTITSGATARSPRKRSLPALKLERRIAASPRAFPYLESLAKAFGYARIPRWEACNWNRVEFVPKNFKTKRTIACEPAGNLPLQLAVDSWLKDRLRLHGVDLSSQEVNQELARQGSIDGSYATIDLESASDNIALDLIHYLFPNRWAKILCDFRSPSGRVAGKLVQYAKYASMGNGSTFTVETLVFFAALRAVTSGTVAVYGDDMICPVKDVPCLLALLRYLGFVVNHSKSFWSGPYRESCGLHWFKGTNVTPVFVRRCAQNTRGEYILHEVCHQINSLAAISDPYGSLATALLDLAKEAKPPLVPVNEDTRSGVFVSPHEAWKRGILRSSRRKALYIPSFKGFVGTDRRVLELERALSDARKDGALNADDTRRRWVADDSRGYFLWHLSKLAPEASAGHLDKIFRDLRVRVLKAGGKPADDYGAWRMSCQSAKAWVKGTDTVYVRRWRRYEPLPHGTPHWIYWWEDMLAG